MSARLLLCFGLIATAALYWAGLSGPFLFDDGWALEPVDYWSRGLVNWQAAVFPNESAIFSRPVAMSSFMLTTWLGGPEAFSYKLGNLVVHLLCGWLGWLVLRRAFLEDQRLAPKAELFACLAALVWLLHPLHVSTVLYAVQRMAQLSTLFVLASLWIYLVARRQLISGRVRPALAGLFIAFPLMLVAGILSKQNAAVAPGLCLVLELSYFTQTSRPRAIKAFFIVFLAIPALLLAALLAIAPERLLSMYEEWDFTLWQRLLTQPRALLDYMGLLVFPRGPVMGLYTDDFSISTGLLQPPITLIAMLVLIAISVVSIVCRKRLPSFCAGWFFFLVAHGVESSFLPLEMYYEHRNYLPAFGLILCAFGLTPLLPSTIRTNVLKPRQLAMIAIAGLILVLGIATFGRVLVWQRMDTIVAQGVKYHPYSIRSNFDQVALSLEAGDYRTSIAILNRLAKGDNKRYRSLSQLRLVSVDCIRGATADVRHLRLAAADAMPRLTTFEVAAFKLLAKLQALGCKVDPDALADMSHQFLAAAATQPETATPKWAARFVAAQFDARAGRQDDAILQAELAWKGGQNLASGALLIRLYIQSRMFPEAERLLADFKGRLRPYDKVGYGELAKLRTLLEAKKAVPSRP